MTLPPRPKTQAITVHVPEHLVAAFHETVDEFFALSRGGQTSAQRAAEVRERDRDAGLDSLAHLVEAAEGDSHQAAVIARFLAGLYNGQDFRFDLTDLRCIDDDLFEHCLAVLRLDHHPKVEVHRYFPDGQARWQRMIATWKLDPTPPAEPAPAPGARLHAAYFGCANASGYRDMTLKFSITGDTERQAPIEVALSSDDTAYLAQAILDVHRLAWADAERGPIDRKPGENRPAWLFGEY